MRLRRCGIVALTGALASVAVVAAAGSQARPFGHGHAYEHRVAIAPYVFANTILRLRFDVARRIVYGDETAIVRPKRGGLTALPFDTLGIHYTRITVDGRVAPASFDFARERMSVRMRSRPRAGTRVVVEFAYWAQPTRGLYFVRPDRAYPAIAPEIWTQGEPEDNRRWFPTWDEPNEKTPSELVVTVPRGWSVVGNGTLVSRAFRGAAVTWTWSAPHPKSTYLIAFVAGPLSRYHTTLGEVTGEGVAAYGDSALDVDAYVQPDDASLNAACFGSTNEIVAYFQRLVGVRYPWAKYDQMTAERFIFGGMENASATIQTELALHPAVESVEASCDGLVSHELAQQWFGDDATMASWADLWLHEGFATYFEELWSAKHFGESEFEYERYRAQQTYFAETQQYYRPIVDSVYSDPFDLFDTGSHEHPGEVLHMLRYLVGDARFFKALHAYLLQYQYKNATTREFFAAIDRSLGTDLTWFENEWFYRDDFPSYHVTERYDPTIRALRLDVEQHNHDGRPFRMPVVIEAFVGGRTYRIEPEIDRNEQVITMCGIPSRPDMVLFDPNDNLLRELTFVKSVPELAYQLARAQHVGDREWALAQLANLADSTGARRVEAQVAVRRAVTMDSFYGVRADATAIAASFQDAVAIEAALGDEDVRVRLAAESAAGTLRVAPSGVVGTLWRMSSDADPKVAAVALASLGALKAPGAYDKLVSALHRSSFRQTVAAGALQGLAAYGDLRALPLVIARTSYGTQEQERNVAIVALARLAAGVRTPSLALPRLVEIVEHDPLIASRMTAASALGVLGSRRAIPALERVETTDPQIAVQDAAWDAIETIDASR